VQYAFVPSALHRALILPKLPAAVQQGGQPSTKQHSPPWSTQLSLSWGLAINGSTMFFAFFVGLPSTLAMLQANSRIGEQACTSAPRTPADGRHSLRVHRGTAPLCRCRLRAKIWKHATPAVLTSEPVLAGATARVLKLSLRCKLHAQYSQNAVSRTAL